MTVLKCLINNWKPVTLRMHINICFWMVTKSGLMWTKVLGLPMTFFTALRLELSHLLDNMNLLEMFLGAKVHREWRTRDLKLVPGLFNSGVEMPTARIDEIFSSNLWKNILRDKRICSEPRESTEEGQDPNIFQVSSIFLQREFEDIYTSLL